MESRRATMAKASRTGATPLHRGLSKEIMFFEILVRLPPKSLLRCRAVCRSWRRTTSKRRFLLAHHARQPALPIICSVQHGDGRYLSIQAFDHQAADAQIQPVARLNGTFSLEASCDGLLILSMGAMCNHVSVCNPVTRQHAPLRQLEGFTVMKLYPHRPTGEYRILLHMESIRVHMQPNSKIGCYVFVLGSDQPPRYIGEPEAAFALCMQKPCLVRDSLHWFPPLQNGSESRVIFAYDTAAESFRQKGAPVVHANSHRGR
ncbi:hypothetical protein VPH35_055440 [Triticum aestivum]